MKKVILILSMFFLMVSPAYALTVNFDAGTTNVTTALTGFSTSGDMMDGMAVTVYYVSGSVETLFWADWAPGTGGVFSPGQFAFSESGDTFSSNWTLSAATDAPITRVLIDAGPGNTVFDRTWPIGGTGGIGTPGSALGKTFEFTASPGLPDNLTVTYRDEVALSGSAPVGDLYRRLDLQFSGHYIGIFNFIADTDNINTPGDITPVPEPGTLFLMGLGLLSLVGLRRKV